MIRRAPQAFADFFGCSVAQDSDGSWYLFDEKPIQWGVYGTWSTGDGRALDITEFVITPKDHDWTILYEPHSDNKDSSYYSKQADSDNKPEYHTITAHAEIDMEEFEQGVMVWIERGWKPSGGISFDKRGCPHQVVVRGL